MPRSPRIDVANETVTFDYRADLSSLERELAKLPGIADAEASKMADKIGDSLKRADTAAEKSSKKQKQAFDKMRGSTEKATESIREFSDNAGDSDSILKALGDGLDLVSPKAGDIARTLGDAAGAAEGAGRIFLQLNRALVPFGVAVLALGGAWAAVARESNKANEKQEEAREELNKTLAITQKVTDAKIRGRLATGELTKEEAARLTAARTANELLGETSRQLTEEIAQLEADTLKLGKAYVVAQKETDQYVDATVGGVQRVDRMAKSQEELGRELQISKDRLASKRRQLEINEATIVTYTDALVEETKAEEENNDEREHGIEVLEKWLAAAEPAAKAAQNLATIEPVTGGAKSYAEIMQENVDQTVAFGDALVELGKLSEHVFEGLTVTAENYGVTNKKALLALWQAEKAAASSTATIQSAVAVLKAMASAPTSEIGLINAAAVGIAAGIQIDKINAAPPPVFHAGGLIGTGTTSAPDEQLVRARRGEAVLTSQAVSQVGRDAIAKLNRGDAMGGRVEVVNVYKHKVFDAITRDSLRRDSPLGRAFRSASGPVGQR